MTRRSGRGGYLLSGGMRQRIGLARAVYGRPAFVVLDEPSSNLDAVGDAALAECLEALKERGTTVVIISHRTATLASDDKILVLREGLVEAYGSRDEINQRFLAPAKPSVRVLQVSKPALTRGGA